MNWFKKLFSKKEKEVQKTEVKRKVNKTHNNYVPSSSHDTDADLLNPLNIMSPLNPISPIWHNNDSDNYTSNCGCNSSDDTDSSSSCDSSCDCD